MQRGHEELKGLERYALPCSGSWRIALSSAALRCMTRTDFVLYPLDWSRALMLSQELLWTLSAY